MFNQNYIQQELISISLLEKKAGIVSKLLQYAEASAATFLSFYRHKIEKPPKPLPK